MTILIAIQIFLVDQTIFSQAVPPQAVVLRKSTPEHTDTPETEADLPVPVFPHLLRSHQFQAYVPD